MLPALLRPPSAGSLLHGALLAACLRQPGPRVCAPHKLCGQQAQRGLPVQPVRAAGSEYCVQQCAAKRGLPCLPLASRSSISTVCHAAPCRDAAEAGAGSKWTLTAFAEWMAQQGHDFEALWGQVGCSSSRSSCSAGKRALRQVARAAHAGARCPPAFPITYTSPRSGRKVVSIAVGVPADHAAGGQDAHRGAAHAAVSLGLACLA